MNSSWKKLPITKMPPTMRLHQKIAPPAPSILESVFTSSQCNPRIIRVSVRMIFTKSRITRNHRGKSTPPIKLINAKMVPMIRTMHVLMTRVAMKEAAEVSTGCVCSCGCCSIRSFLSVRSVLRGDAGCTPLTNHWCFLLQGNKVLRETLVLRVPEHIQPPLHLSGRDLLD